MAKNVQKSPRFGALDDLTKPTVAPTPEQEFTPTPAPTLTPTPKKELKTKRLQLVLRESTVTKLGQYAEQHDTSRNDVVQKLLDDLLGNE